MAGKHRGQRDAAGARSFVSDVIRLANNQVVVAAVGFITGVILARTLGADGRGLIAAVLVYPMIFRSLADLGVRQAAVYHIGRRIYTDQEVIGAMVSLILFTSTGGVLLSVGLLVATGNPDFTPVLIGLAVATLPLAILKAYAGGIFLGKKLVGQFTKIQQMAEVQRLLITIVLVWWLALGVSGALAAIVLSSALVAAYALKRVAEIAVLRPRFQWHVIRSLLLKGFVYAVSMFVMTLNYKLDVALMERLTTVGEIGLYSIAVGIAQLTWALPQSITPALFSHSANERDEQGFAVKVARLLRVSLIVAFLLLTVIAISAPFVVPLVYGAEFQGSVLPLQLLLPGVFCMVALKILNSDLAGRGRPTISLLVMTPALVVNVLLNMYLIPHYGAVGAAIASSISYTLGCAGMVALYSKATGLPPNALWQYRLSDFDFMMRFLPAGITRKP